MASKRSFSKSPSPPKINDHKYSSTSKSCKVCADEARIINYGALSCQSCQIFFRGNGLRLEVRHFYTIFWFYNVPFSTDCSSMSIRWWMWSEYVNTNNVYCMSPGKMFCSGNECQSYSERNWSYEKTFIINWVYEVTDLEMQDNNGMNKSIIKEWKTFLN